MSPFNEINDKEKEKLLENFNAHIYNFNKGDELITLIDKLS